MTCGQSLLNGTPHDSSSAACTDLAAQLHPGWHKCSQGARKLHARNVAILLGPNMDEPVDAVLCWTPNAAVTGGTGMGISIAMSRDIPVFNFAAREPAGVLEELDALAQVMDQAAVSERQPTRF